VTTAAAAAAAADAISRATFIVTSPTTALDVRPNEDSIISYYAINAMFSRNSVNTEVSHSLNVISWI